MEEIPKYCLETVCFLPENFLRKTVNEPFIQKIMSIAIESNQWLPGNPNRFEPDYFCDGVPFEFTVASDRKKKGNYIQKFYSGRYQTEDAQDDIFCYVKESIQQKLTKRYFVPDVHLCVLCLMDLTYWVMDEYGSCTYGLMDCPRKEFFQWIKHECIETNTFNNVFLIFPDIYAKWWVWDVLSDDRVSIALSKSEINSGQYPFWMEKGRYEEIARRPKNMD